MSRPVIMSMQERPRRLIHEELHRRGLEGGRGVEVGVKKGEFSEYLLQNWRCRELLLVDPWEAQEKTVYDEGGHDHPADQRDMTRRLKSWIDEGRARVMRMQSVDAARTVPDGSLDFVQIDGNHSYRAVADDMEAWWPKLRSGGVMMGDDQHREPVEKMNFAEVGECVFGVRRAVDEFAARNRVAVDVSWVAEWSYPATTQGVNVFIPARNWLVVKN